MKTNTLPRLPQLPSTRTTRNWGKCACGCGRGTQSTFAPGHDARLKGAIQRVTRGVLTLEQLPEFGFTIEAVTNAMADRAMMQRWNLTDEVAAYRESLDPEREAKEEAEAKALEQLLDEVEQAS